MEFTRLEASQIKNLAKSTGMLLSKKAHLEGKKEALDKEIALLDTMIAGWDAPIRALTASKGQELGLTDIIVRTVKTVGTDKKTGKPIRAAQYNIKPEYLADKDNTTTLLEQAPEEGPVEEDNDCTQNGCENTEGEELAMEEPKTEKPQNITPDFEDPFGI